MRRVQISLAIITAAALTGCPRPRSAELSAIVITPENGAITRGGTLDFVATGVFDSGEVRDLTGEVVWQVDDGFLATVDPETPGRIRGLAVGATRLRASQGSVVGAMRFDVIGGAVVRLEVSPSRPLIPAGLSLQLRVNAVRADDSVQDVTAKAVYAVMGNAASVAVRDEQPGVVVARSPGRSEVLVSFDGVSALVPIEVSAATVRQLSLSPSNPTLPLGTTLPLRATASLSDGRAFDVTEQVAWSSSAPQVVFVSTLAGEQGLLTARAPGSAEVRARLGDVEISSPVTVTMASLSRLEADPPQLTLAKGTQAPVRVQAIFSDGTRQDVGAQGTWTSEAPMRVSVSAQGLVRALETGVASVRFDALGQRLLLPVSVTAAELTSLELSPPSLTLAAGTSSRVVASGRFSDGSVQDLTGQALWSIADGAVASVTNTLGQRGLVQGLQPGVTTLTAALGSTTARLSLTVSAAQLVSLSLAPAQLQLPVGASADVVATGVFTDGSSQDLTRQVSWSSSAPAIAAVDPVGTPGRVSAVSQGQATIRAEVQSVVASLDVDVTSATLQRLELTPARPSLALGTSVQLTATGVYSDSSRQDLTGQVTWSSENAAIASLSNAPGSAGRVTAAALGQTVARAQFQSLSASVPVEVTAATLQSLAASQTSLTVPVGLVEVVTITGLYSDGTTQDLTGQVTWSSDDASIATASNASGQHGRIRGVTVGVTSVRATLGARAVVIAVSVTPAQLASLALTPPLSTLPRGANQQLQATGTFSDGSTRDLTAQVSWSSTGPALSVTGGLVAALQVGAAEVVARQGAIEARLPVSVTAAALVSLSLTPALPSAPLGVSVPFVATGSYTDGSTRDVTALATWSSSAPAIATISNATGSIGRAIAVAVGSTTITAELGSQQASTTLSVGAAALDVIEVSPATSRIANGTHQRFQATGRYTDGSTQDLSTQVLWSVSDVALASVSASGPFVGRVRALQPGEVQVRATRAGVTGVATLTITNSALVSLAISPAAPSAPAGLAQQLTVTGTFQDGSSQDLTDLVTWSSSDPAKVSISNAALSEGLARALAVGTSTITASALSRTGAAVFTVTSALLTGLEVSPAQVVVPRGLTHDFVATGRFSDGTTSDVTDQVTWASSAPLVASISNASGSRGRASAVALGAATISASLSGQSASASLTVSPAVLQQLQVTPPVASVARGLSVQFTATGVFSDGSTADLTEQVSWSAGQLAVAQLSNVAGSRGRAQSLGLGTTSVTAVQGTVSGTGSLTVTAAELTSVQVAPAGPVVPKGLTRQLSAIGLYTDGTTQDLTSQAGWSSADVAIATVSTASGSEGMAQAMDLGVVTITANVGGRSGSTQFTVSAAVLQVLQVSPVMPSVPAGLDEPLTATGIYSDSSTQDLTSQVTWSSSDALVATVSNASGASGVVTGRSVGSALVSATLAGVTGSTTVTVTPSVLQQLQVTPTNPSRPRGLDVQLTATGLFSDGSTQDLTTQVTWTSSDVGVAPVSNASGSRGLALAQNVGAATLTAAFGMVSGSTVLTVTTAQLTRVDVTPSSVTLPLGTVRQFQALGRYTDGTTQNLTTQATWLSSNLGVLDLSNAPGSEGLATTLAIGAAQVTMTFGSFTQVASVTISQAALASIELTPSAGATPLGFTRQFIAIGQYTDGTTQVLTSVATWSSSDPTRAFISNAAGSRGLLSTVAVGAVTIEAVFNGVTGSTSHNVSAASLVSLSITPGAVSVANGGTQQLSATGSYSDGSTQDLTGSVTWSSSAPGVAQVSNASGSRGLLTAVSPGSAVVTAQSGTVSRTVSVSVSP